tara:strand:+ start:661 stop:852 length:192 start_codon:yes stop_codon:yes gene_type:complete
MWSFPLSLINQKSLFKFITPEASGNYEGIWKVCCKFISALAIQALESRFKLWSGILEMKLIDA